MMDVFFIILFAVIVVGAIFILTFFKTDEEPIIELVEDKKEELNKARNTMTQEKPLKFKAELEKSQERKEEEAIHEAQRAKRETERKAEQLKIEQAKRKREAEIEKKHLERRSYGSSGVSGTSTYQPTQMAESYLEPSYSSDSCSSSSSSYDSGSSSSSSDSGSSSYSSCD